VSERQAALRILASFIRTGRGDVGLLHFGRDGSWSLALDPAAERASLQFTRYARPARRWGTVLPAALDRHPKDRIGHELASIIFAACTNIGLPREAVDGLDVEIHKHAPVRGGPSAPETRKALPMDSTYRNKPIVHLVLTFREPVRGPMILGAGRFRGLGLCLPLDGG
jgi:CRISPR-associated protein Csb2